MLYSDIMRIRTFICRLCIFILTKFDIFAQAKEKYGILRLKMRSLLDSFN